jgi:FkbM family methyltransferase
MKELNRSKFEVAKKIVKSILPAISYPASGMHMQGLLRYAETGVAMLQGKGAGAGWDLRSEIRAAAACVHRPKPVLLDVGANYGRWAQGMVQIFPATQNVFLFEPQEACLSELRKLDLPGKVIVSRAVGDHPGTRTFHVGKPGWAAASFYERTETFFSDIEQHKISVPVTTLDAVIQNERIEFVDFAKFDIEGAELSALHGAVDSLSRGAIGAMSLEFGSGNINSRTFFRDFWDFLTAHGFEIFRILPGGGTSLVSQYYEDLEYFRGVSNYVARRKIKAHGLAA